MLALPGLALGQIGVKGWPTYGGNAQHTGLSPAKLQGMDRIRWSTPVDLDPQYSGDNLYIHYGSPLATPGNTLVVTVKTGATDGFKVEGRKGYSGSLLWTHVTDYTLPSHNWVPSCGPCLISPTKVVIPGAGGTTFQRTNIDSATGTTTQGCFYGVADYILNKATMDAAVKICTPLTPDSQGNVYFGFVADSNPLGIVSGIAKVAPDGTGTWRAASDASGDASAGRPLYNCAPALNAAETEVYMTFIGSDPVLSGMSTADLSNIHHVKPLDPKTGNPAVSFDDGTSSPTVAPDGDIYFGAFDNPFSYTHLRGYMYRFSSAFVQKDFCGAFGWDDTASIIPRSMVPSYQGSSPYLLMTKYNNYLEGGGAGDNRLAILDPNDFQFEAIDQTNTMKEVLTILGPTADPRGGVVEWCINTAAVDVADKAVLVNSEDGKAYCWDLVTNSVDENIRLTDGRGEAYTPTVIGPDGTAYSINDAQLFAIGNNEVLPESLQMSRGTIGSGGLSSLLYTDSNSVRFDASAQSSLNDFPVQAVVTSTCFNALSGPNSSLKFQIGLSQIVGDLEQRIEMFNYLTSAYELVSLRSGGNNLTKTLVSVANPARFVQSGTKQIKARLSYRSRTFPPVRPTQIRCGLATWTATP